MELEASLVLGVDVGGTYTDAVVVSGRKVISSCKRQTTLNKTEGIVSAIKGVIDNCDSQDIVRVCIGTTHFINAVVERSVDKLSRVAVVRLCGPASIALPPFSDFPSDLSSIVKASVHMISGGLEYNGNLISPLSVDEIKELGFDFLSRSPPVTNIVISGIFSPMTNPDSNQEVEVANILHSFSNSFSITLASKIGKLGILERENAAILNESLKAFSKRTIDEFKAALQSLHLNCPFYLTQNDGTLISVDEAIEYPIFTFSSGSTNSMRGAMFLSGKGDGIVVDIGGTTTDVGVLVKGFPREASSQVKIGGVKTNFRVPNVVSIGLGGGSLVVPSENSGEIQVGPNSVGMNLTSKAICFGGDVCTATDIAVAAGICKVDNLLPSNKKKDIISKFGNIIYPAMRNIHLKIEEVIDLVKITKEDAIVILVGGGSILVDTKLSLKGAVRFIKPPHFEVANAVGAALGMIAGYSDSVESLSQAMDKVKAELQDKPENEIREEAQRRLVKECMDKAVANARLKGCIPGSEYVHEQSVVDVTYVPDMLRISVKVIGLLKDQQNLKADDLATPICSKDFQDKSISPSASTDSVWPYQDVKDITLDNEANLPSPHVNKDTGEWLLNELDVECISIGAGILGCGGGGSPSIGCIAALNALKQGKEIKIHNPLRLKKGENCDLIAAVAFMGAPAVLCEKLFNGTETTLCLKTMQRLLAAGLYGGANDIDKLSSKGISASFFNLENKSQACIIDESTLPDITSETKRARQITGLMSAEIGGMNSIEPLLVGANMGLPVLDADGMGRAFPELQMYVPFINGLNSYPCCVASEKGEVYVVSHVHTSKDLEDILRIKCVEMGMTCGICLPPVTLDEMFKDCIIHSYSRAWQLGRCVMRARISHSNVVQAIAKQQNGILLLTGKVVDIVRVTEGAFTGSVFIIKGTGLYSMFSIQINAKNENLVAREVNDNGTVGHVLATTPDLITVVDSDSGYPITTEEVKYGLRVSVLVLPADSKLLTDKAISVVGPKGFQMSDIDYIAPVSLL